MKNAQLEYRSQINLNDEKRVISGYAAVFESRSKYLGFYETLKRGSITEELIKQSDVVLNYDHQDDKILGRSRYGEGTLKLSVDEKGLYFECELGNTTLANDVYESIKRGDLFECSFAFTIEDTEEAQKWYYNEENELCRDIYHINELFDSSVVCHGAYGETSVTARKLDYDKALNTLKRNMTEDKEKELLDRIAELEAQLKEKEEKEVPADEPKDEPADEPKEEKELPADEPKDEPADEPKDEPADEPKDEPADEPKEEKEDPEKEEEDKNIVRNIMNLQKVFRKAYNGSPVEFATRAVDTINTNKNTVATEVENILAPIYADSLIGKLGMKVYSGLTDQKKFPILGKPVAGWMGEQGTTSAGTVGVGAKYLEPHILKVMIPVSHTLLVEDNVNFEATLKDTMVNALKDKLEATLFSDIAANDGGADNPAGILNGLTTQGTIASFTDIANLEAVLENANYGNLKYAVAPNAKATLRTMIKGTNGTGMVMENGEIDGTEAYASSCVATGNVICGDFSQVAVGIWDTVRVEMVNDSTLAGSDQVMFVVTMYADFEAVRTDAIAFATV